MSFCTVSGNLKTILGVADTAGSVRFELVNIPAKSTAIVSGVGILAPDANDVAVDNTGAFSVQLYGNDSISPTGTLYAITFYVTGGAVGPNLYNITGTTYDLNSAAVVPPTNTAPVAPQTANTFYGGPASGGPAVPTFRSPVPADIPALDFSKITTGKAPLAQGGTNADLSATGGATSFLAQDASHVISVRTLANTDIPNLDASKITTGKIAQANGGTNADLSASGSATAFLAQDASHVISARSIVAGDVPTLNQDTTGKSAKTDALNSATTVVNVSSATAPSSGQILTATSSAAATWQSRTAAINYVIDGGGSVPTTGAKGQVNVPIACTIKGWVLTADQSGSAVVDVLKSTYAGFPTTSSIASTDKPTLSSVQKNENLAVSVWTTAISAGDQVQFNLNSVTTCTRLNITLIVSIP